MSIDTTSDQSEVSVEDETNATGEALLEVSNLEKHFVQNDGIFDRLLGDVEYVHAVDGVDLTVHDGETVAIVGESGCGKSTLAETVLNLHRPSGGTVQFKGEDIAGLSQQEMRPYRRQMQIIFQDPLASLNPRQTVGQILRAPMEVHDIGADKADRTERAGDLLEEVGLKSNHLERYPHQFSGGQQQRIGLARALSVEPDLLIADEPVSALDVSVQSQVLNLFGDLQEEYGLSMLFIAHDLSVVRHIADRVAVMYLGQVVETAPVEELFENPRHPYTKALLSAVPRIDPAARGGRTILRGTVPSPIDPPQGCRFHTRCPAIIPPDDWTGEQAAFRDAFTFRTRIEEDRIDPAAVRTHLESEGEEATDEAVVEHILDTELPTELGSLPDDPAEEIRTATVLLVDGEQNGAADAVRDALPSPCVDESPRFSGSGEHSAACHRVDPDSEYHEII